MIRLPQLLSAAVLASLTGCVSLPSGPSVMTLPGTGKTFDQFRQDEAACRYYGHDQVRGATPEQTATEVVQRTAVFGTLLGAAAGAIVDGRHGAGIGAVSGLLIGSAIGSGAAADSAYAVQERYDVAYTQCMYAKGHRVPLTGRLISMPPPGLHPPPPPGVYRFPPPDFRPRSPPG